MVDGGALIYELSEGRLAEIITPEATYTNTGDAKFMLAMQFGAAAKYTDDLSDAVKRGNRKVVEMGKVPGGVPIGYLKTHEHELTPGAGTVVPNPERFDLVKRLWKEAAWSNCSILASRSASASTCPSFPDGFQPPDTLLSEAKARAGRSKRCCTEGDPVEASGWWLCAGDAIQTPQCIKPTWWPPTNAGFFALLGFILEFQTNDAVQYSEVLGKVKWWKDRRDVFKPLKRMLMRDPSPTEGAWRARVLPFRFGAGEALAFPNHVHYRIEPSEEQAEIRAWALPARTDLRSKIDNPLPPPNFLRDTRHELVLFAVSARETFHQYIEIILDHPRVLSSAPTVLSNSRCDPLLLKPDEALEHPPTIWRGGDASQFLLGERSRRLAVQNQRDPELGAGWDDVAVHQHLILPEIEVDPHADGIE